MIHIEYIMIDSNEMTCKSATYIEPISIKNREDVSNADVVTISNNSISNYFNTKETQLGLYKIYLINMLSLQSYTILYSFSARFKQYL